METTAQSCGKLSQLLRQIGNQEGHEDISQFIKSVNGERKRLWEKTQTTGHAKRQAERSKRERDNEAVKKRIKFEETDEETGKSKLKRQTMGYYHNLEDLTGIE